MSNNPFETPSPVAATVVTSESKTPTALTVICVICLVLGALGVLGSCAGLVTVVFAEQFQALQMSNGDEAMDAFTDSMNEIQNGNMIPTAIMSVINLILSPLMLIGAIATLGRKRWGYGLLKLTLLLSALYCLFRLLMGVIIQMQSMGPINEAIDTLNNANPESGEAQAMASMMGTMMWIGLAFAVIWGVVLIGYYFWAWMHMKKDHMLKHAANLK